MARSKKSSVIPVTIDGVQVGSLRQRYKTWQFRFRLNGLHREVTFRGVRDLDEALRRARIAAAQAPAIPTVQVGDLMKKPRTLQEAGELYLGDYAREFKQTSYKRVRQTVLVFIRFVGPLRPTYSICRDYLQAWRRLQADRIQRQEITASSANGELRIAKAFVSWLRQEGLVEGDPTFKIKRFKEHSMALAAPSRDAVDALLKKLEGSWVHDFAVILANTGLRPGEGLHLHGRDLDAQQKILIIQPSDGWTVKDYETRKLALNDTAFAVLLRLKLSVHADGLLFPNSEGKPLEYHNFKTQHWRPLVGGKASITPYDLRHYFATQCAASSEWKIQQLSRYLGHASIETTMKYYADIRALSEVGMPPVTTRSVANE